MIIACPTCAAPFQVLDDQIAPLVQVACPHCGFRMILDFQAANDPSLIDPGTQMAAGYRSEADYQAASAGAGAPEAAVAAPAPATPTTPAAAARKAPPSATVQAPPPPPRRRSTSPPRSAPVPPPPKHKSNKAKSKKTLIATPGMMAQVPTPPSPRVSETDGLDSPDSLRRESEVPHEPARKAEPSWPTEAAEPPTESIPAEEMSQEILPPASGGALKASPAPAPASRSGVQTALLWGLIACVAIMAALWISAFQSTGDVDPRPFIQQTLIPSIKAKLGPLLGG